MSYEVTEYDVTQPPTAHEVSEAIGQLVGRFFDATKLPTITLELTPATLPEGRVNRIIATLAISAMIEISTHTLYASHRINHPDQFGVITIPRQPHDDKQAQVTLVRHHLGISKPDEQPHN